MAEEEETREVLFSDWSGPEKQGMTLEQSGEGEIYVKEVKMESPAGRTGRVHEGDQIVGATIYFDNMSSKETTELLKTLNKHKVGLKLQNKDKSPCRSPMGTLSPCRSPMGTLTVSGSLASIEGVSRGAFRFQVTQLTTRQDQSMSRHLEKQQIFHPAPYQWVKGR
uniref:PDZ domain-containing protein n=1 Tax=Oncorhynchus tshawytscha TaxID=74940 RepID=A0A8C8FBC2_ONCTS